MKMLAENYGRFALDVMTFAAMTAGMALLLVGFLGDRGAVAVPGLILLLPSLIYGMR